MPTTEVVAQLAAEELIPGTGPIRQGQKTPPPQSLVHKQRELSAVALKQTVTEPAYAARVENRTHRVHSTGARTPGSLAAEIQAQIDKNAARASSDEKKLQEDAGAEEEERSMSP